MSPRQELAARQYCEQHKLQLIGEVGSGAFKRVYHAKGDRDYAIKVLARPDKRFSREVDSIRRCDHPNIAKVIDSGIQIVEDQEYPFLIEEFLDGGSLQSRLNAGDLLGIDGVRSICSDLSGALGVLRQARLVHRDIKPDNIMFRKDSSAPILVDFGVVRDLSAESYTPNWLPNGPGTPYFSSPEQLQNKKAMIDWRSDQFSLGVTLGVARYGAHPWQQAEAIYSPETLERLLAREYISELFEKKVKEDGLSFLLGMLGFWPFQRYPSPEAIIDAMEAEK